MADERVRIRYDIEDNASGGIGKIAGGLKSFLNPATLAAAAVAGIGAAIGGMILAAEESRQVMAQTEAVIKSTGGAAGVSAEEVSNYAQALSQVTNFDDEAIQGGQNLLLTFTKIGKDVFPDATQTMLDMSAALGQDLKGSAIQLGKALNDPIQGITALRRVGVSFTEEQERQIKVLVESGRTMEAQKLILAELKTEFGGVAKATASPLTVLKNQIGNVGEAIGGVFLGAINSAASGLVNLINKVQGFSLKNFTQELLFGKEWAEKYRNSLQEVQDEFHRLGLDSPVVWKKSVAGLKQLQKEVKEQEEAVRAAYATVNALIKDANDPAKRIKAKFLGHDIDAEVADAKALLASEKEMLANLREMRDKQAEANRNAEKSQNQTTVEEKFRTVDQILAAHDYQVAALKAKNKYSYQAEVALYDKILAKNQFTEDERIKISTKRLDLIAKANEDAAAKAIEMEENKVAKLKVLGQLSTQQERDRMAALLDDIQLNEQQREAILQKLADLDVKLAEEKLARNQYLFSEEQKQAQESQKLTQQGIDAQLQLTKIVLDSARKAGQEKLSLEKQIANGILDYYKRQVIAEVDAMAAKWAIDAGARIVSSWGFDIGAWGLLTAAAAASAGIRSALSSIQLADGGIVMPRPGGVQATIAEAGQAEAVIPLNDPRAKSLFGGNSHSADRVIILDSDGSTMLAKGIYRKQQYLQRTGQLSGGLI